jgi:hypothetical protein
MDVNPIDKMRGELLALVAEMENDIHQAYYKAFS